MKDVYKRQVHGNPVGVLHLFHGTVSLPGLFCEKHSLWLMVISLNLLYYIYNGLLYLEKGMMHEESTEYLWEGFVAVPLHSTFAAYRLRRE